jgi:hypothetical protein
MAEALDQVRALFRNDSRNGAQSVDLDTLKGDIRGTLKRLFERRLQRRPVILPTVLEVDLPAAVAAPGGPDEEYEDDLDDTGVDDDEDGPGAASDRFAASSAAV